ncbi:patatin-like phospholipase family protein [Truepera radiovictrix]|uniref:Patatin n=1 Tax=Truepera radiovictrix (strain DSM 17093 / CIP 108686 / LMG 22925 / RQ-24) TaxID=649638 RepID=D7CW44_TRURR|nr:patatin-like phospholipase family protein [Truepera radiovictrix]ADI14307.1 Patatin [Truepera radiovictrix DSM 17093]WMT57137.1 patatin-like phospholipase family protein [Truepera radiovictrix]
METGNAPPKKRVGLILSGGAARGFAHIGLLRVLERAGITVDVIAGTSMGAILGAFYASGHTADDIYRIAKSVTWRDLIDLSLHNGLLKGLKLHAFLASHLPETFGELQTPLVVATTDLESGEEVFIFEGDLITAVRASSCFPGAFEPVTFNGRTLADGGIVNNLPINAVSFLHANFTIAGDATVPRRATLSNPSDEGRWWERMMATFRLERRNPMAQTLLRATDIMGSILTELQYTMHPADLRVQYPMPHLNIESFWALDEIVAIGEWSALQVFVRAGLLPEEALGEVAPPPAVKAFSESTHPPHQGEAAEPTHPALPKALKAKPRAPFKTRG